MKNTLIFVTVLIAALCCAISAAALEDFHYNCELSNWDIATLSGKEFRNLYLDVEGCGGYTIVEGIKAENVFYNGGRDTDDHMIMFVNSSTFNFYMPCEDTHQCYLTVYGIKTDNMRPIQGVLYAMPSGDDKGKIIVESGGDTLSYPQLITNLVLITGTSSEIKNFDVPKFSYISKRSGIELGYIHVDYMFIANDTEDVISSVKLNSFAFVMYMLDSAKATEIYHPEDVKHKSYVYTYTGMLDGNKKELSIDNIQISIAHILGDNKKGSVLRLKTDSEIKQIVSSPVVKNLFLFGANMELYGKKNRDISFRDINNLIVLPQPEEYSFENRGDVWSTIETFYDKYMSPLLFKNHQDVISGDACFDNDVCIPNEFELLLDARLLNRQDQPSNSMQASEIRAMSILSQHYAVDIPDNDIHWNPYIDLFSASIGKVICAKTITKEVSIKDMFQNMTDSYISGKNIPDRTEFTENLINALIQK